MKRKRMSKLDQYQALENRNLMAVVIGSHDGNMWVHGEANGTVEVKAVGDQSFQVSDNGVEVGTYNNVFKNLRINLDQNGAANDDVVRVEMLNEVFENITINLGDGNNEIDVTGTHTTGGNDSDYVQRLRILGGKGQDVADVNLITNTSLVSDLGHGDDSLTLRASTSYFQFSGGAGSDHVEITEDGRQGHHGPFFSNAVAYLGHGDDTMRVDTGSYGDVNAWAGPGADAVEFTERAELSDAFVHLGTGDNTFNHDGWVASTFRVRAAGGNDVIEFSDESVAAKGAEFLLGEGNNSLDLMGHAWGDVFVRGEDGVDSVRTGSGEIRGDFVNVLGDGDNSLDCKAAVSGNLFGFSRNGLDSFINTGDIEGELRLLPGGQTW